MSNRTWNVNAISLLNDTSGIAPQHQRSIKMYTPPLHRRAFLFRLSATALALTANKAHGFQASQDPWSPHDLTDPADLAKRLRDHYNPLQIVCVTFPVLYRQRHISHAALAGPANKPEGLAELRRVTNTFSKESEIVLYCGCCPMTNCPNVRPAFRELKKRGFKTVRVLNLPSNFHTDWVGKGYPVET